MSETKISAILTVEGLRKFQTDMNAAGDAVDNTAKQGVLAGGKLAKAAKVGFLAAGAAAIVSVKKFADFDDAMNRVKINSGASASEMGKLEKAALKMGKKFPASSAEVAEAMNEILKAGMSVEDMLSGGLENALAMATAEGMDMAASATAMSQAMSVFAVEGKNANTVTAALSNVASGTSADINDLTQSLAQVGGTAKQAGMGVGDTTAALGVLIQNGLDGSKAGTALNSMLLALRAPTAGAAKALKSAGVEVYDATGKMRPFRDVVGNLSKSLKKMGSDSERAAFLQKTFGVDAQQAASILSAQLPLYDKLAKGNQNLDAPVQKARDQMQSLKMQLDTTGESLSNMAMKVGSALAPSIVAALPHVQHFADAIGSRSGEISAFAAAVVEVGRGAATVLMPALQAAGAILSMFGGAVSSTDGGALRFAGTLAIVAAAAHYLAPALAAVKVQMAFAAEMTALNMAMTGSGAAMSAVAVGSSAAATGLRTLAVAARAAMATMLPLLAVTAVATAMFTAGDSAGVAGTKFQDAASAARDLKAATDALANADASLADKQLAAREASNQLKQARENATAASKNENLTESQKEAAVLAAARAYLRAKEANKALKDEQDKRAKAADDAAKKDDKLNEAVKRAAKSAGKAGDDMQIAATKAAQLGDAGATSSVSVATFGADMDTAAGQADGLGQSLDNIPDTKTVKFTLDISGVMSAASMAQTAINNLKGGSVKPKPKPGMATGGRVYGAGTGTSDSVPAMLSAGEWVLTAKQAKAIGYGTLASIPKFAQGGAWFTSQANSARASMQSGSPFWKAMERARATSNLGDDRSVTDAHVKVLQKRLAAIKGQPAAGKGDTLKQNRQARGDAIRELDDMIRELRAQSWQITNISIPGMKADQAAAAADKLKQQGAAQRQASVAAVGASGSAVWQQSQMAGTTDTLDDDLAALQSRLSSLQSLNAPEAAQAIADTEGEIWTLLNVTAPQQQRAATQAAINAVGGKGSDLWKRSSIAATTDTLDDDLAVLQERLAALQAFGPEAAAQIAEAEADIWTMQNITMPAQAQAAAAQADAWRNEAAMAMGRGFYSASGGGAGGGSMGITDTSGGDAGGVGHAPRPEIDRVWLAGEQINDLDARSGAGVTITEILGWDEAEDFESTRAKRADGDALGGTRDGSVRLVVRGRLNGSTYQDYHERRRVLKGQVRAAVDQTVLKVPDVTYGDDESDYADEYAASGMVGMERRIVRLTSNLKWGESFGQFGSEFEFELRSPHRFVEADVAAEAPSSTNAAALTASTAARTSILAIRGEIAASPAMDSTKKFYGTSVESVLAINVGASTAAVDTFTKLTDPASLPASNGNGAAFDASGDYLAVAHTSSPYVTIYSRSGGTFAKLTDPASLPTGSGLGAAFDPSSTYLAIAHTSSPYVTIYSRSGSTFTKLSDPATLPAGTGNCAAFDPSGTYLAIGHATTPFVTIYQRSGDTFTKLTNPASLPASTGYGAGFDPSGTYLAIAHLTTPFVTIYKRSGSTFTKLTNPASLPASTGHGAAFDMSGAYLAVPHDTTPYVTIYSVSGSSVDSSPLGTITVSPPALAISSRTDVLPVASADISTTQFLTSQDSYDIDTIAGTATPVHRTPLARLIGGPSFIAGIIPSRYAGGPTTMLEVVTRSAPTGAALVTLGAFAQSNTDVVNSTAGGEDDYIGVLGALTATPATVATGMPGWRAKRSAANFTASSYARRIIGSALGQPKSRPVIHTMLVKPAAAWATAESDLSAFGAGVTKFAHLLTLEVNGVSSTNYINAVGFFHNGTRLVPACVRYDDKATDAYRFTYANAALATTPLDSAHVWVCAIIDAGVNLWNAIVLVDLNTGEPVMYFIEGHSMFDKAASETTGGTFSQTTTTTSSGTLVASVAYPTSATRYLGCGSDTAGWAASVAGTTVPAGGMGAIITLDAALELYDHGITDASVLTGAASATQYSAISSSILEWVRARFAPQSIRRAPIALESEWTDRVPDLHGEPIVRIDSVVNSTTLQALGASNTGGLSTEQMTTASTGGAGETVIEAREVR